jgi:hypothetical protein
MSTTQEAPPPQQFEDVEGSFRFSAVDLFALPHSSEPGLDREAVQSLGSKAGMEVAAMVWGDGPSEMNLPKDEGAGDLRLRRLNMVAS